MPSTVASLSLGSPSNGVGSARGSAPGGPRSRADDLLAASGVRLQDRLQLEVNQVGQVYRHGFGRITLYSELGFAESFGAKHLGLLAGSSDGPFPSLFYRAPPALPGGTVVRGFGPPGTL